MTNFGETIKKYRENFGYSQQYVANLINMNQSNYSKIERGIQEPNLSQLKSLAEILHFSIDDILGINISETKSKDLELLHDIQRLIRKHTTNN